MNKLLFLIITTLLLTSIAFAEDMCTLNLNTLESSCDINDQNATNVKLIENGKTQFYLFVTDGCPHCKAVEEYLSIIEQNYDLNATIVNVRDSQENLDLFTKIRNDFGIKSAGVPLLIINGKSYLGENEIIQNIKKELETCKDKECKLYIPKSKNSDAGILEITALAITDSINPCELAILLILLSAVLLKFSKKSILYYGFAFIATIFICYLLMGIGLIFGFKLLSQYATIGTTTFSIVFGIIAIVLGILNLKDAISYGAGGFVMEVPMSWRPTIKKIVRDVTSIWSAIVIAIIVSFFLLPCTGGPYLLVSGLLHMKPWSEIILWLLYYNFIFILPMILVTLFVYFGLANVEKVDEERLKFVKIVHLVASIILIIMGIYLVWKVI